MFIRRTQTGRAPSGEQYFSHRLVQAERVGGKVRQVTLLNLGRHFPVPKEQWPIVCIRIEELVCGHQRLIPVGLDDVAESEAQRIAAHLIAAQGSDSTGDAATPGRP